MELATPNFYFISIQILLFVLPIKVKNDLVGNDSSCHFWQLATPNTKKLLKVVFKIVQLFNKIQHWLKVIIETVRYCVVGNSTNSFMSIFPRKWF